MLPFHARHMCIHSDRYITGLSKIARVVRPRCKLQVRRAHNADRNCIQETISRWCGVVIERRYVMQIRGVQNRTR
jgi:GTP cyclohydrolase I